MGINIALYDKQYRDESKVAHSFVPYGYVTFASKTVYAADDESRKELGRLNAAASPMYRDTRCVGVANRKNLIRGGENMADGTTVDSLQIEIEASSAEAEKKVDALTAALERLKKATTGFGNVGDRIKNIGASASNTPATAKTKQRREALNRAVKGSSIRTGNSGGDSNLEKLQAEYQKIGEAFDVALEKYERLEGKRKEINKTRWLDESESRVLHNASKEVDRLSEKYHSLGKQIEAIAREAGLEMVGKMGNKTAVINNQQIVDALKEAVYQGTISANQNMQLKAVLDDTGFLSDLKTASLSFSSDLSNTMSRVLGNIEPVDPKFSNPPSTGFTISAASIQGRTETPNYSVPSESSTGRSDNSDLISAFYSAAGMIVDAIQNQDTGVYLDGKTLMQSVEKAQRQRGANIMGGGVL